MLKLMYITNRPQIARIAERHGVDRIFVDLETLGKEERQAGRSARLSTMWRIRQRRMAGS